jgi:hypothetical protein
MSKPSEHKTVQARILAYAQEIGWTFVSREEAERRRGLNHKERSDRKEDLDSDSLSSAGAFVGSPATGGERDGYQSGRAFMQARIFQ